MSKKLKTNISLFLAFILSFSLVLSPGCGQSSEINSLGTTETITTHIAENTTPKKTVIEDTEIKFEKITNIETKIKDIEYQANLSKKISEKKPTKTFPAKAIPTKTIPTKTIPTKTSPEKLDVNGELKVTFIDVGQGDSILIQQGDSYMLIDAGESGETVLSYLHSEGVSKLDFLIATHPHADHIGKMADVVNSFELGKVIMPDVTHTTQTFENLIDALIAKNQKLTKPVVGDIYELGEASFQILAPNSSNYQSLNDYSIAIRLIYGNNSFIFTGDCEALSENEIVINGLDIDSDVLKVSHHGSDTSSTDSFLSAVNPAYAVIMCGVNNQYGHPHKDVLNKLETTDVEIYRTDLDGTIIATSNGEKIEFSTSQKIDTLVASPVTPSATTSTTTTTSTTATEAQVYEVFITNTGSKFHTAGCRYLKDSKISIDGNIAIDQGYTPCKVCSP